MAWYETPNWPRPTPVKPVGRKSTVAPAPSRPRGSVPAFMEMQRPSQPKRGACLYGRLSRQPDRNGPWAEAADRGRR